MSPSPLQIESVSRETHQKLEIYVEMLEKWNKSINLVSKSTLKEVWRRHIEDSLQIADEGDNVASWVDLGSGGGLPGLIIAAAKNETSTSTHITMIESDQRKCAFIAAAANAMDLSVSIECRRIEESTTQSYDVISARALAPLSNLLELAQPYRHEKTICIFPKGANAEAEMKAASEDWSVRYQAIKSSTNPTATIFKIQDFSRAV